MGIQFARKDYQATAEVIGRRTTLRPSVAIILGSGLGSLADSIQQAAVLPYDQLPNWPLPTVAGHAGRLVIGLLEGRAVAVMQGRVHYYEGYDMTQVGFPVRVLQEMGMKSLVVTNAAGAINPEFQPGEVMLITDHLNLIGMGGLSPLRGPNEDSLGPRFPDMSQAYDRDLQRAAREVAREAGLALREGVYACLAGPSFETPADLRFLRVAGADAVGMSTVPEVITARHGGSRVVGFSGISNKANLDGSTVTTHEEVLAAGRDVAPKLDRLIRGLLRRL